MPIRIAAQVGPVNALVYAMIQIQVHGSRSKYPRRERKNAKIEDGPYRQRRAEPKQAERVSGLPLEWKPVGRSDEGTPVRRQNKARLPVPGAGHSEPTGEVHTLPAFDQQGCDFPESTTS